MKQMQGLFDNFNLDDLCENKYDNEKIERMYKFPASTKEAQVHRRATKFGYNATQMKDSHSVPICPCCENLVNTVPIPLCYGTSPGAIVAGEPKFLLNSGTAMYFIFIKMCIFYLLMRFIIADGFNLWTSYKGHFCKLNPRQCSGDYNSYLSGYNKHTQQDVEFIDIVGYLNVGVTVASIIFFYYCRKYQFKLNSILQHSNISQDQFSIYIENIPIFIYEEETTTEDVKFEYENFIKNKISEEIKKWVAQVRQYKDQKSIKDYIDKDFYKFVLQKNENLEKEPIVSSISLCYDLAEMDTLADLRKKLMDKHIGDESVDINNIASNKQLKHIPNQIKIINTKYIQLSKKFALDNSPAFNLSHFLGKAFITFNYQHYRQYFLREAAKSKDFFKLNDTPIKISRPSQPQDVFWTNLNVDNEERASTVKQSFVVLMIILLMSLVVLVGVDQIQVIFNRKVGEGPAPDKPDMSAFKNVTLDNAGAALGAGEALLEKYTDPDYLYQQFLDYLFIVLLPALTNFVNFVITFAIDKLTFLQRHKTKTHKVSSFIVKNILARFINTAIIYFILSLLHQEVGPLTQQGVVIKVMGLVGVTAFIQFITEMFRPEVVFECVKNALTKLFFPAPPEEVAAVPDQKKFFQIQLNEQVQDPQFAFAEQYTFYLVQIWLVSFFAIMVPAAVGILALIFTVQYWQDKHNLFRKFSCPLDFNFFLSRLAFKGFECSLFVFAVGTFIFDMEIRVTQEPKYKSINLISCFLAAGYLYLAVFGPEKYEIAIFSEEEDLNSRSYDYYKYTKKCFRRTYWTENPATIFLKEKNINDPAKVVEMPPDDKFVKPEEFDKYIALTEDDIVYEVYDSLDENVFKNYGNDDYNEDFDDVKDKAAAAVTAKLGEVKDQLVAGLKEKFGF